MTPEIIVRARMLSDDGLELGRSVKLTLSDNGKVVEAADVAREDGIPFSFVKEIVETENVDFEDKSFWSIWVNCGGVFEKAPTKRDRDNLRIGAQNLILGFVRYSIEHQDNMSEVAQPELFNQEYTQIVPGTRIQITLEFHDPSGEILERTIGSAQITNIHGLRLINTPSEVVMEYS